MWNKIFSQLNLIRFGLAMASVAIILLILPRADHKSYTYELNQPWKYPLLTADFDMPILRDSTSARLMRDSIDRMFVPFVKRDSQLADNNIERFKKIISEETSAHEQAILITLLTNVYNHGILDTRLYEHLPQKHENSLRLVVKDNNNNSRSVTTIDASDMLSPAKAYSKIDSIFTVETATKMSPQLSKALNICLAANIVVDTVTDYKYRSQEYLTVTGAMGVIKTGQRIVDRGEIVTPQIFTNLNTYMEMMATRHSENNNTYFIIGEGLFIIMVFGMLYTFLYLYRPRFFHNPRQMTFLMAFISLFVVFAVVMFEYVANGIFLVPFAAVPVIILVFFDARTAIFSLVVTVMISALVATFSITQLSRRSQLLRTALLSFVTYAVTYFTSCLILEGNLTQFSLRTIGIFAINSIILSFAYIFILMIEKIFGFTSTVTLVELSDINSPLLRKLAEVAPGTFQHSIQVSTIAAEAARAIGANTTLVRTGALYHDIGKMNSPIFFTENQHGVNPHAGLNPETSAHKIISHVTEGLQMASKEKLPEVIRDFISQHHGRGITKYFYTTAVNENPDKVIDKTIFEYPGPNPQSRETAILMMADAVEAASRSLKEYTQETINNLVDKIIDTQIADGLLKEAPISFRDIESIKKAFKSRLSTIYHSRVQYPEMNKHTATVEATAKRESDDGKEKENPADKSANGINTSKD